MNTESARATGRFDNQLPDGACLRLANESNYAPETTRLEEIYGRI